MSEPGNGLPSREDFSRCIDTIFKVVLDDGQSFDLCLFKLDPGVSNSIQEVYSLLFRAPVDAPPVQSLYSLEHEQLGKMELFLVPVKKKEDGLYYEAVFNHLLV